MAGIITSLPPPVAPPPANTTGNPQVLGPLAYVPAIPTLPQTWTGLQTFNPGTIQFAGSTSGATILNATAISSGTLTLPAATDTLVGRNTVDTLTNKTLTSPVITGATISGSSVAIHSTGTGNFDLSLLNSENLTAGRSLTLTVNDASRTLNMGGNITTVGALATGGALTTAGAFTISGAFGTTLTVTGTTSVTLPTAGTLATLAGAEALTNKTLNGNTFTAGTYTLTGTAAKTLTFNNSLTLAGTDGTTQTFQASDTIVGRATTDTLTNKTYDTAGTGNSFKINGTAITAVSGTGSVALTTSPAFTTPVLGTPTSGTLTNCTGLPLSGLANQAAWTFVFNNTSGSAAPTSNTIDGLTLKGSPAASDELIIWDVAGAAIKKATVSSVAAGSTVASIAGNTGAFTLDSGITNTVNAIEIDGNYTGWGISNCTLAASVASNILTVAVKDNAGNDPSATSPCFFNYRNVTAATGSTTLVKQTAALSITTNATGATLGSSNNTAFRFWVVVFNNGGTNVLALINCSTATQIFPLNEGAVASSTAMSGSATSAGVFYTPTGTTVTSKAFRILGYVEYNSTGLATAGTYATGPNFIQTFGPGIKKPGDEIQSIIFTTTSAATTTSSTFTSSNCTLNITPTSAANLITARSSSPCRTAAANLSNAFTQIFRGSTALAASFSTAGANTSTNDVYSSGFAWDLPNTTASTTYTLKFRNGDNATTITCPITANATLEVKEIMS